MFLKIRCLYPLWAVFLLALLTKPVHAIELREIRLLDQAGCQLFYPQLFFPDREPSSLRLLQATGTCVEGAFTGGIVVGIESTRPADGKQFVLLSAGLVGAGHFCGARLNLYENNKQEFTLVAVSGATMWKGNKADPSFDLNRAFAAVDAVAAQAPCVRQDLVKDQLSRVVQAWNQDPLGFFEQYTTGQGGALPAVRPPSDAPKTTGRGARGV